MNFLVRRLNVNLQFPSVRAHPNVLIMIDNFNEVGIRILFQFFDDGMKHGQSFARPLGGMVDLLARNEMHGHGLCGRRKPHMNVRAAGAVFVDVDTDDSFTERIGAGEDKCAAESESGLADAWKVVEGSLRGVMQVRALNPLDESKVTARLK